MPNRVTPNMAALPMPGDRGTIESLRRKLGFRAWHRGMRAADLPIVTSADQCLVEPQE